MMKSNHVVLASILLLLNASAFAATDSDSQESVNKRRNANFKLDYTKACGQELQQALLLPATKELAAQHEINVNIDSGHRFKMNENGVGYLQLAITEWNEKLVLFYSENMTVEIKGADMTDLYLSNLACSEQKKQISHVNTHEWGSYVMELNAEPNSWVELTIVKETTKD
ncbi:hypothetical protein HWV01_18035 [Moritella sp. 5]|nr:hypothetical protein HWV01_18035 [Moritella sp. 5]